MQSQANATARLNSLLANQVGQPFTVVGVTAIQSALGAVLEHGTTTAIQRKALLRASNAFAVYLVLRRAKLCLRTQHRSCEHVLWYLCSKMGWAHSLDQLPQ